MYTVLAILTFTVYFLLKPILTYILNPKGLNKYPTYTPLCALTSLAWCLETWRRGIRSKRLAELHKTYRVIRTGPNSLSYGHPDAYRDMHGHGHGTKCVKHTFYQTEKTTHFNLGNVIDKTEHTRKREMLAAAFAAKNVQGWEFKVAEKVRASVEACDRHCTSPLRAGRFPDAGELNFDFRAWSNFFTIYAIGAIALSENLGLLHAGDDAVTAETVGGRQYTASYRDCLHASKIAHTRIAFADKWYHFTSRFTTRLLPSCRKLWRLSDGWNGIVHRYASKRLKRYLQGEKLDDIFQYLLHNKEGEALGLEWGEIAAETAVILDAGCLARLREEIDEALEPEDIICPYDKVKNLPYLRACLDESLRITPPISYNLPRRTPPEGAYILGEFVPGDTTVSMSSYVVHRDKEAFPDAEKYIPERWLDEKRKDLQSSFVPFSAGPRGCIGRNISYLEQTVLVATPVHRYEFALPSPGWEQERVEVTNLLPGALPLKVWKRGMCI
ncbi:cytochrome P450 [Aspergillus aurantiobrunneus]